MAADRPRDPRRRDVRRGLLARSLTGIARAIQWLLFSLVFSIAVEWVGMAFWWPEQGLEHTRDMLAAEIDYLHSDVGRSLISADPVAFAKTLAERTYFMLFDLTGIESFVGWLSEPQGRDRGQILARIHAWLRPATEHVVAAMQVTQVFAVRLAVLLLAAPVFGLFALVGLVDGLVSRDLRGEGKLVSLPLGQTLDRTPVGVQLGGLSGAAVQPASSVRGASLRGAVCRRGGCDGEPVQEISVKPESMR